MDRLIVSRLGKTVGRIPARHGYSSVEMRTKSRDEWKDVECSLSLVLGSASKINETKP